MGVGGGGGFDPHWARFKIPTDSPPRSNYEVFEATKTVLDKTTGLEWERAAPDLSMSFSEATKRCKDLGHGFRVPSRIELQTIWFFAKPLINLDEDAFAPLTNGRTEFWSTSVDFPGGDETRYWTVEFSSVIVNGTPDAIPTWLRCVRTSFATETPSEHYVVGAKVIKDQWTGLTWAVTSPEVNQAGAKPHCAGLTTAPFPVGWRVPMTKELLSIWDETKRMPPYWDVAFDGSTAEYPTAYWGITHDAASPSSVYTVDFARPPNGSGLEPGNTARIRCVHD